jgi:site-specific recombinase XerD
MSDVKELLGLYQQSPLYLRRTARELFVDDDGAAFTAKSLGEWLKNLYERAEVYKNGGLYVFRRSMATIAQQAGIPTVLISRQLRHETLEHTGRYINVEFPWEEQVRAVEKGVRNLRL